MLGGVCRVWALYLVWINLYICVCVCAPDTPLSTLLPDARNTPDISQRVCLDHSTPCAQGVLEAPNSQSLLSYNERTLISVRLGEKMVLSILNESTVPEQRLPQHPHARARTHTHTLVLYTSQPF